MEANNISKSIKFRNNTYLDTSSIVHNKINLKDIINKRMYGYQDTSASDVKELLRKKIAYGSSLCTTNNESIVFSGGWSGINFGVTLYSQTGDTRHAIWFSTSGIYLGRQYNGNYEYYQIPMNKL